MHIVPFKILLRTFLALITLTALTVIASELNLGEFNLLIALTIATLKASLVLLVFMHLYWDNPFNAMIFIACLIFVALFISLALLDSSQYQPSIHKQQAPAIQHKPITPN